MSKTIPITARDTAGNLPYDPKEGSSHPPPPPPPGKGGSKAREELRPALRWMRGQMVREFVKRMRDQGRKKQGKTIRANMRKRKTALAMSAAVMSMSTGAVNVNKLGQPVAAVDLQLEDMVDATKTRVNAEKLKVSDTMKEALAEEEGVRLTVYRDVAGYPTVGVGHLITPKDGLSVGDRISYDRAIDFLEKDLKKAENAVKRLVGDLKLYQHEFDALVDLVFNVGEGNVSAKESPRLNLAIAQGDYRAIADELEYTTAAGKVARGLQFRSERRQAIFMEAAYEDPRAVEVDSAGRVTV